MFLVKKLKTKICRLNILYDLKRASQQRVTRVAVLHVANKDRQSTISFLELRCEK